MASIFSRLGLQYGDYNHPDMHWTAADGRGLKIDTHRSNLTYCGSMLYDAFCFHGLTQVNSIENGNSRVLDLILVNDAALSAFQVSEAIESLVHIDTAHPAIDCEVSIGLQTHFEQVSDNLLRDIRRADYDLLNDVLSSIDWQFLNSALNLDDAVEIFGTSLQLVIEAHVPAKRTLPKPPWTNNRLRTLKRRRRSALRMYRKKRSQHTKRYFVVASNEYVTLNRHLYARYINRVQTSLKRNPKSFWSFVRSKRKQDGLPSSMYYGDSSLNTAADKCESFAKHFKSAFSNSLVSDAQIEAATRYTPLDSFDFSVSEINEEYVHNAIRKLKFSVSPGPDEIPSSLLKKCSSALALPLVKLFNLSLREKTFPTAWKTSFLFPIHKKGDKCNIENYRGITSLCACSKLLEIIINTAMFESCKNYISCAQHDFFLADL